MDGEEPEPYYAHIPDLPGVWARQTSTFQPRIAGWNDLLVNRGGCCRNSGICCKRARAKCLKDHERVRLTGATRVGGRGPKRGASAVGWIAPNG